MNLSTACQNLPVVKHVDVLIFGGSAGAVSMALEAQRAGLEVYVVSPRSYLGEDICAAERYWPRREPTLGGELAEKLFTGRTPPTPLHVKMTLESALVDAGVGFLFNALPAGLLRDEEGRVAGAVMGHRGGRQGVRARLVIDATLDGQLLALAGAEIHVPQGEQPVSWVTLSEGEGRDAEGLTVETLPGYSNEKYTLSTRRYQLTVDFGDGSPAARSRALTQAMRACWTPEEFRCQTHVRPALPTSDAAPSLKSAMIQPGLLAFSEAAKLPAGAEYALTDPINAMSLARGLGAALSGVLPPVYRGSLQVDCGSTQTVDFGEIRTLVQGLRPGDTVSEQLPFDPNAAPVLAEYDVVVVGGGTGGAPAGIGASRAGAKTLVLEACSALGGVGTVGQIARYWFGNRVGFTAEVDQSVAKLEAKDEFKKGKGAWSTAVKAHWYLDNGAQSGAEYWFNTVCVGAWADGGSVRGVLVAGPNGFGLVKCRSVVDATGCADVPAAAGAPTRVISKDHVAVQGVGLAGVLPGREYHNSDHNFSDDTDVVDATAFFVSSRQKYPNDFDSGELVDSRERRQIIGDYSLTAVDILFERRFPDTICVASSNFDTHGFTIDPSFMVIPPDKKRLWADVPLRCLLPQGLDNVLATGLGVSAHRNALPVIRMQPDVQNHGYAAGYMAALSAQSGQKLRELDLKGVQKHLVEIDSLPERVLTDEDTFPVDDATLREQVAEHWDKASGVALILHEGERSLPLLREAYDAQTERSAQSLRYAQLIALLGDDHAQDEIRETIEGREWDTGWNYTGMGQFGFSTSELDGLIISLATCGDARAWPVIFAKMATLTGESEFSHFRAVSEAIEILLPRHPNAEAAQRLADLLALPGVAGHAITDQRRYNAEMDDNMCNTETRNVALREIHVARALVRSGDVDGRGAATLKAYAQDLRGHFARHAAAVLAEAGAIVQDVPADAFAPK